MAKGKYPKSLATREKIVESSLELFLEKGFEKATMRAIAKRAGLASGAAYYYFESKEHIVFELYQRTFEEHLEQARQVIAGTRNFEKRVAGVISAHINAALPHQEISRHLFRLAADPIHPLSPFSSLSAPLREKNIRLFGETLEGANLKCLGLLKERLPELLWFFQMALVWFWLFDRSKNCRASFKLIHLATALLTKALAVSRLPGINPLVKRGLALFDEFKPQWEGTSPLPGRKWVA